MVDAVLFDLDGTFADTAPDLGEALNHVRALRDLAPLPLEVIRPQASHGSRGLLKLGLGIEPGAPDYEPLREAFLQHYQAHLCDRSKVFPGISALVAELDQRDMPWGIVTNK
ncbi:MAG: HAD hydrolase-like protein, partial [Gallionella sp.]|nr:HAD hydrolase-like protein [Gallionella sp.]